MKISQSHISGLISLVMMKVHEILVNFWFSRTMGKSTRRNKNENKYVVNAKEIQPLNWESFHAYKVVPDALDPWVIAT